MLILLYFIFILRTSGAGGFQSKVDIARRHLLRKIFMCHVKAENLNILMLLKSISMMKIFSFYVEHELI